MAAARKNLALDQGTTFSLSVRYKDSTGTPVDLTGYAATLKVYRPGQTETTPLFTETAEVTADGFITVKVTDEYSATLPEGKLAYALDLDWPNGDLQRLFWGALEVRKVVHV